MGVFRRSWLCRQANIGCSFVYTKIRYTVYTLLAVALDAIIIAIAIAFYGDRFDSFFVSMYRFFGLVLNALHTSYHFQIYLFAFLTIYYDYETASHPKIHIILIFYIKTLKCFVCAKNAHFFL